MRKFAILMVLMLLVAAVTTGCNLIVKDPEVDAQTVIIEVTGKTFTKAEVQEAIENVLDYQEYIYSLYGMGFDRTEVDSIASAQETAINALIEEAVVGQKVQEYGLDQFTDEEITEYTNAADTAYENVFTSVMNAYFADTELTGDELDAAVDARIVELGYSSMAELLEQEEQATALEKLKEYVVKDVAVSDEEITQQYSSGVSNAITTYASSLTQYAADVANGGIIYFTPDGYRYVKNLLIMISDEDSAALEALSTQLSGDQATLEAVQSAIAELPEDPAEDTEDEAKSRTELTGQEETLIAEIKSLTAELSEKTEAAYAAIQPAVDEVRAKIEAGEDFDALIAEYGEDPGMTVEPAKTTGYLVCEGLTTYAEEFVGEAMALNSVGDISDPFRTGYGVHIVQYASEPESGQSKLSSIRSEIKAELLTNKQNTLYEETLTQWITDADAKTYVNRLAD